MRRVTPEDGELHLWLREQLDKLPRAAHDLLVHHYNSVARLNCKSRMGSTIILDTAIFDLGDIEGPTIISWTHLEAQRLIVAVKAQCEASIPIALQGMYEPVPFTVWYVPLPQEAPCIWPQTCIHFEKDQFYSTTAATSTSTI